MSKIFVGTLPNDITEDELRDMFSKYSEIRVLSLKNPPRPPPYAFIEFVDEQAAEDAVHDLNATDLRGCRIRVEICRPQTRERTISTYENHRYGSNYRALVSNLDHRVSWQDLKDIFNEVVDVVHTEVDGRGRGVVSFRSVRDMEYATRKLDDREYYGRRIHVYQERSGKERYDRRHYSRSPNRHGRSASRSRSPASQERGEYRRRGESRRYEHGRHRDRSYDRDDRHHSHRGRNEDDRDLENHCERSREGKRESERERSEEYDGRRHHRRHRHRSTSSRGYREERDRDVSERKGHKRSESRNERMSEQHRPDDNQEDHDVRSPRASSSPSHDHHLHLHPHRGRGHGHGGEGACYGSKSKAMNNEPHSRSPSVASGTISPARS